MGGLKILSDLRLSPIVHPIPSPSIHPSNPSSPVHCLYRLYTTCYTPVSFPEFHKFPLTTFRPSVDYPQCRREVKHLRLIGRQPPPAVFFALTAIRGTAMKAEHVDRVDILYAPLSAAIALSDLRAVKTDDPDRPYTIDVKNHVRNRDGYKSKLMLDIAALRRNGAIINYVPSDAAKALIAKGELDAETLHPVKKPTAPATGRSPKTSAA